MDKARELVEHGGILRQCLCPMHQHNADDHPAKLAGQLRAQH